MGPIRNDEDKGEIDGYFGLYDQQIHANPADFKKVETPEGKRTTLIVGRRLDGFSWKCTSCEEEIKTRVFERPLHTCK